MTVRQLRIYTVRADQRAAFLARWDAQARPLMERHGFRLVEQWEGSDDLVSSNPATRVLRLLLALRYPGRWRSAGRLFEFGYVLAWEDEEQMRNAWSAFLADGQWQQAKAATRATGAGEPVVMVTGRLLDPRPTGPGGLLHSAATDGNDWSGVRGVASPRWRRPDVAAGQRDLKACR